MNRNLTLPLACLFLALLTVSDAAFGAKSKAVENFPTRMKYLEELNSREISETSRARIDAWAARTGESAYYPKGLPVEGVITDSTLKRWILVTPNRRVNPEFLGRIFAWRGRQLLHLKVGDQQLAILLNGYSEKDAMAMFEFLSSDRVATQLTSVGGRSPASEAVGGGSTGSLDGDSSANSGSREHGYALEDSFAACAVGVKEGVEGALISPFTMAWGSVKSLAKNPSAWWERSVNEMTDVMETASDFGTFAKKKWADFKSKPPSEKSKLYCSFVGGPAALGAVAKVSRLGAVAETVSAANKTKPATNAVATTAVAEPMKNLIRSLDEVIEGLKSSSPEAISAALEKAKKLDVRSIPQSTVSEFGQGNFNGRVSGISNAIKDVIERGTLSEAVRLQAAEAYLVYGKTATNGWREGYLGRHLAELLPDVYGNYNVPDSARRVLYAGLEEQRAAIGLTSRPFETAAALKAKDTVGFLGVTKESLTYAQQNSAYVVEKSFRSQPVAVQREIYSVLESGRALPGKHMPEFAQTAYLANLNGLRSSLRQAGYVASRSERGNLVTYTHPETGSQIVVASSDKMQGGAMLRPYTEAEIRSLRAAMARPNGRFTILTNAER